ncbi:MAG: hypothetical protein A3C93_01265 [Candidatus Lloydbacteria bacterium RIFCSPHIGHO2_02_FULL_54_17]|uniref:Uncharacterized protein n=1 Tax=Candidatus Lloydbacteria bacterium RIFCSPHIGHO2_02_FULL_54_17 TaxID=1798664 RepID=A0A1G2DAQ1_9BACT|nr:MAG: hypothetical protein A2762_02060 [Candidatus Lloydbacteria bacterium RIFCSPHIGHO2_01_FULL_54_11]OGZ10707.1 MAG: hypothetical protein A3C93_01265 [Candidatus Lloydbacteria bacterium RIFCSPHIGHO2_02_FULL_54_17]OGZ12910.1 MAG: hypothetical protein A2948_00760 [Candidatus Lloydbacteria bacterium RIFCSPLOWO2_01_FULL_54_18]
MADDDIDDVLPPVEALLDNELAQMNEDEWVLLKNELQEYLHRIERSEYPAYESADIIGWLDDNGEIFDRFYQHLRSTKPELLLRWKDRALDLNEMNDTEFIRTWAAFRETQKAPR